MIDIPKFERLSAEVAAMRGELDYLAEELTHERRQLHLSRSELWRRIQALDPKAVDDPASWLELSDDRLALVALRRHELEAVVASIAKVARLSARREQLGNDLQPRVSLLTGLRAYVENHLPGRILL